MPVIVYMIIHLYLPRYIEEKQIELSCHILCFAGQFNNISLFRLNVRLRLMLIQSTMFSYLINSIVTNQLISKCRITYHTILHLYLNHGTNLAIDFITSQMIVHDCYI